MTSVVGWSIPVLFLLFVRSLLVPRVPHSLHDHKDGGFLSPPSGIRTPCASIISSSNTCCVFLQSLSPFRSRSLPIRPRTPICRCASPSRRIPARFDRDWRPLRTDGCSLHSRFKERRLAYDEPR